MPDLVIFGTKNFAEISQYYFQHDSDYNVVALTVDGAYMQESTIRGVPVVPFEELEREFPPDRCDLFVAIGHQKVNTQRATKVAEGEAKGYRLARFVSSRAHVHGDLVVGPNCMIMEHCVIQPFVTIGKNSMIWSTTRIGFHGRIGNHCWIVCALFGESVDLGDHCFVGLNATITPCRRIGQRNVIGAGAIITKDTRDDEVYPGFASAPSKVPSHRLGRI